TPARSTQIRMDFSQRYALIAGSQACGANLENCKRDSSEVRSCNAPCSQRNLIFLIGSIGESVQSKTSLLTLPFAMKARTVNGGIRVVGIPGPCRNITC